MLTFRPSQERGATQLGWLDSRHTFSFGDYYDPRFPGFRALRVINEDRVLPGAGFPPHPHRDMEILSYIVDGALAHRDSLGNGAVIRPGELQRMSAGTGIRHSEYNASSAEPVHFLQIWITPDRRGLPAGYEQKRLPEVNGGATLQLIGAGDGRDGAVTIHQDVDLYRAVLNAADELTLPLREGRAAWVQAVSGSAIVNGQELAAGDGIAVTDAASLHITGRTGGELLVFDLA